MYGEFVEQLWQRGAEVLTPFVVFLQRQSPLISPGSKGGGEEDRSPPLLSNARQEQNHQTTHGQTDNGWFCCSLAALQDPPKTLARTGSRRARLTVSRLSAFFGVGGRTDGQTYRNLRLIPKEGSLDLLTKLGRGDEFRIRGLLVPPKRIKPLL